MKHYVDQFETEFMTQDDASFSFEGHWIDSRNVCIMK